MADKDDTSKVPPDRNSDPTHVSAETSSAEGDREFPKRSALTRLERTIEAQREQLLQAYGVLTACMKCCCMRRVTMRSTTRRRHTQRQGSSTRVWRTSTQ